MKIIDFTPDCIRYVIDRKISLRKSWDKYEKRHSNFFNHYFSTWASRKNITTFLKSSDLTVDIIEKRVKKIIDHYKRIQMRFKELIKNNIPEFDLILFVGVGTTNGHAFKDKGKFKVWIPIETYKTERQMYIFIAHEVAHAVHFTLSPTFYFKNERERLSISRQLITEGIATYLTMLVNKTDGKDALWADYIPKKEVNQWYRLCKQNEKILYQNLLANFDSSDLKVWYFAANDPNDIQKYRSGYYCGLKLIQEIAKDMSLINLLSLDKESFSDKVKNLLMNKVK